MTRAWVPLMGLALMGLAACDGGSDGGGGGGGAAAPEDSFGATFAAAFDLDATDAPIEPVAGDLPAIDLTADPIDL